MPYKPFQPDEHGRSFSYKMMWLGLPLSILLVIGMHFDAAEPLIILTGGYVSGIFLGQILTGGQDEYFLEEINFASRFALSFAGLAMFAQIVPRLREWEFDAGYCIAIMALIFNAAIYYRRIADGAFSGGDR